MWLGNGLYRVCLSVLFIIAIGHRSYGDDISDCLSVLSNKQRTRDYCADAEKFAPSSSVSITGSFRVETITSEGTAVYCGNLLDGKKVGCGQLTWPDKSVFIGNWGKDLPNGVGMKSWPDGSKYYGSWLDGKFDGEGRFDWPSGSFAAGHWVAGELTGSGIRKYVAEDSFYEGNFYRGARQGYGRYTTDTGVTYRGEWERNLPNGAGTLTSGADEISSIWKDGCSKSPSGTILAFGQLREKCKHLLQ